MKHRLEHLRGTGWHEPTVNTTFIPSLSGLLQKISFVLATLCQNRKPQDVSHVQGWIPEHLIPVLGLECVWPQPRG